MLASLVQLSEWAVHVHILARLALLSDAVDHDDPALIVGVVIGREESPPRRIAELRSSRATLQPTDTPPIVLRRFDHFPMLTTESVRPAGQAAERCK